jgi:SAM-dependent methyltransferase
MKYYRYNYKNILLNFYFNYIINSTINYLKYINAKIILDYGCGSGQLKKKYKKVKIYNYDKDSTLKNIDIISLKKFHLKFDAVVFNHVLQYFSKKDFKELIQFLKKNKVKNVIVNIGKQNFLSKIISYCFFYINAHSGTLCSYEYQKKWIKKYFEVVKSSDIFFINKIFLLRLK